jgi:predicted MFS family arabinose efflux permease
MRSADSRAHGRSRLFLNSDFRQVWGTEAVLSLGGQISVVAIPIVAALYLNASPSEMGLLGAMGRLPQLALGLMAGAFVDRLTRRSALAGINVARALAVSSIPIAAWFNALNIQTLVAMSTINGLLGLVYGPLWSRVVPKVVAKADLPTAYGRITATNSLAQILGPIAGGFLVSQLAAQRVLWFTVAMFVVAAMIQLRVPQRILVIEHVGAPPHSISGQLSRAVRLVWTSAHLRTVFETAFLLNLGGAIFNAVYVIFLLRHLHVGEGSLGWILGAGGAGGIVGAVVIGSVVRILGPGRAISLCAFAFGLANFGIFVAEVAPFGPVITLCVVEFVSWGFLTGFDVNRTSIRQAMTPDAIRGTMSSLNATVISSAVFLGNLIGGFVGDAAGVTSALWVGASVMLLGGIRTYLSGIARAQTMDDFQR